MGKLNDFQEQCFNFCHDLPLFKFQMLQECLGEQFQARLGIPPTGREASLCTLSQDQGGPSGDLQGTLPNCHGASLNYRVHKPIRGLLSEEVSKAYFMRIICHSRSKSSNVWDFFCLWLLPKFDKILFVSLRRSRDCLHVFLFVCPWLQNQDVEKLQRKHGEMLLFSNLERRLRRMSSGAAEKGGEENGWKRYSCMSFEE